MTDKRIKNPLWNSELDIEKRLDFLIENLTLDEKNKLYEQCKSGYRKIGNKGILI